MKTICIILLLAIACTTQAQDYIPSRSNVGITGGATVYTGRYSVKAGIITHTAWNASLFYNHTVILPRKLFAQAELTFGQMRGDNTKLTSSDGLQGAFLTDIAEGDLKILYEITDGMRHRFVPYAFAGGGVYRLFNYYSSSLAAPKSAKDKLGIVLPIGGGIKYGITERIKLMLDGNLRLFCKNLDNVTGTGVHNPNRYYTFNIGATYALQKINRLW